MKTLLLLGELSLLLGIAPLSSFAQSIGNDHVQSQFVGAWRLASLEQPHADGKLHRIDCSGMFVFTRDGHLSVQIMEHNPSAQPAAASQYSQGGYEASFGTYTIDERTHTFTFHVEGALVRTLIGKDLPRSFEFSGKQLIVKSTSADEHWKVTWEHY